MNAHKLPSEPTNIAQLIEACCHKNYKTVINILTLKPDTLKEIPYLFNLAINNKDTILFNILIDFRANLKDPNHFLSACETGFIPIIKTFIKNGAQKNNVTLSYACKSGSIKALLLIMKSFVFSKNEYSFALTSTIKHTKNNKIKILKLLLKKGADINYCCGSPLQAALEISDFKTVTFLLKNGANYSFNCDLKYITKYTNFQLIKHILKTTQINRTAFQLNSCYN